MLQRLETADGAAELLAGFQIVQRDGESAVHHPKQIGGGGQCGFIQRRRQIAGHFGARRVVQHQGAEAAAVLGLLQAEGHARRIGGDQHQPVGGGNQEIGRPAGHGDEQFPPGDAARVGARGGANFEPVGAFLPGGQDQPGAG